MIAKSTAESLARSELTSSKEGLKMKDLTTIHSITLSNDSVTTKPTTSDKSCTKTRYKNTKRTHGPGQPAVSTSKAKGNTPVAKIILLTRGERPMISHQSTTSMRKAIFIEWGAKRKEANCITLGSRKSSMGIFMAVAKMSARRISVIREVATMYRRLITRPGTSKGRIQIMSTIITFMHSLKSTIRTWTLQKRKSHLLLTAWCCRSTVTSPLALDSRPILSLWLIRLTCIWGRLILFRIMPRSSKKCMSKLRTGKSSYFWRIKSSGLKGLKFWSTWKSSRRPKGTKANVCNQTGREKSSKTSYQALKTLEAKFRAIQRSKIHSLMERLSKTHS